MNTVQARRLLPQFEAGERRLVKAIVVVALLGVGIAGYLTYVHYAGIEPVCAVSGGCEKVQTSEYSKLAGVSVAVLGLAGYLVILVTGLLRQDLAKVAGGVTALVGFAFSAYLTYRELFTIHAICQWCVASAILMTVLAVLTTLRVWRL